MTSHRDRDAMWAHIGPFAIWIALMLLPGEPSAWKYALRTGTVLAALLWFRPWRWYAPPRWAHVVPAVIVGVAVFALWVLPESAWAARWPAFHEFYVKWAIVPMGHGREALTSLPYAPEVCGWPLTIVRLLGPALIVPIIEEVFWRGFLYRYLQGSSFLETSLQRVDLRSLMIVSVFFGAEHHEWLTGIIAGLAFAVLMIRTNNIWSAVLAHAVTNLLLGLYVLKTGAWQFW